MTHIWNMIFFLGVDESEAWQGLTRTLCKFLEYDLAWENEYDFWNQEDLDSPPDVLGTRSGAATVENTLVFPQQVKHEIAAYSFYAWKQN